MRDYRHFTVSPEELLPRIAAGDADAFAALFRKHSGDVFRFALHMTGSRPLADDVTQDVFMAVMRDAADTCRGFRAKSRGSAASPAITSDADWTASGQR